MCEGNEHSVETSLCMCDLVFLNRSEQALDCGTASSLAVGSGRRKHQFHLHFPFQLFLCFTLVHMETCKGPKNLIVISVNGDEKKQGRVRVTLNTKEGYSSMYLRRSQPEDSATYLCASTQCPSALCSPYPNPCLLLLWDQH